MCCTGEEDQDAYDISRLQKTELDPLGANYVPRRNGNLQSKQLSFSLIDVFFGSGLFHTIFFLGEMETFNVSSFLFPSLLSLLVAVCFVVCFCWFVLFYFFSLFDA